MKNYNPEFIANYLEIFGIKQILKEKDKDTHFQISDIEELEIPNISLKEQQDVIKLLNPINTRASLYKKMIDNDKKISKYVMKRVTLNDKQY